MEKLSDQTEIINLIINLSFMFGPVTGYLFQIREIIQKEAKGSFSENVSLIIIYANILRIFFWFDANYFIALLFQSIIMVSLQVYLFYLCKLYDEDRMYIQLSYGSKQSGSFLQMFQFSSFSKLMDALSLLVIMLSFCLYCFGNPQMYSVIGWMALILESFTPFPQILSIYRKKDCKGVSKQMLFLWIIGDSVKTYFYYRQQQPLQFQMGGCLQIILDGVLWVQVFSYQ